MFVIVELAGRGSLGGPLEHLRWPFFALTGVAELLTFPAYLVAYRSVGRLGRHGDLDLATLSRIVVAGFGPIALAGGFGADRSILGRIGRAGDDHDTQVHVSALSTLEWTVLGPISFLCSLRLLVGHADVSGSLLWPWLIGVPLAAAVALWLAAPGRRGLTARIREGRLNSPARLRLGVLGVQRLAREPRRFTGAWIGMLAYWLAEIAALDCALRAAGIRLDPTMVGLAYTTGCLASRRSVPLGGAGLTEALFVLSLDQLHQPIGPAVAAVLFYRVFNFMAGIVPAWVALRQLDALT